MAGGERLDRYCCPDLETFTLPTKGKKVKKDLSLSLPFPFAKTNRQTVNTSKDLSDISSIKRG